jgi:hypothetical protein
MLNIIELAIASGMEDFGQKRCQWRRKMQMTDRKAQEITTCQYLRHENSYADSLRSAAWILWFLSALIFAEYITFSGLTGIWSQDALAQPLCGDHCGNR